MRRFSFRRGLRFLRQKRAWLVVRRLTDGSIQLEAEDGELWNVREADVIRQCAVGELVVDLENSPDCAPPVLINRDLSSYPEPLQARALRRQMYLQRLRAKGPLVFTAKALTPLIREIAAEIGDPTPPSPVSIYRWNYRYSVGASVTNLIDHRDRLGRRRRWSPEIQEIVTMAIDTILLHEQRYPRKAVCDKVFHQVTQINRTRPPENQVTAPSRATLYRYMACLEDYELTAGRHGKAVADRRYRMVLGTQKAERLLERVEIDHTPLNVLVFCEKSTLPLGKPWLTAAIDKYSRMIVGFYIGFHTPSAYSVLSCLAQAILPKEDLLKPYPDITTRWPARGLFEVLVCDNGMELHASALAKACEEFGVQLQFCPAKTPEYKGAVERVLKTINHDLIHRLPGTVFSNVTERGEYDSENLACISFDTLLHVVTKWIVEIYNQTPHRSIGMPPAKKWEMGERERILEYPAEPAQVRVILAHCTERRVFHYGVEVNGLRYNNADLQLLRRRHGEDLRVTVKYHEGDVGYIHVFDPDQKAYFEVQAIDQGYAAGLRLIQHELIRAKLRKENEKPEALAALLAKKHELQDLIHTAAHSRKMATRKRKAVMKGVDSVSAHKPKSVGSKRPKTTPATPLPSSAGGPVPKFKSVRRDHDGGESA